MPGGFAHVLDDRWVAPHPTGDQKQCDSVVRMKGLGALQTREGRDRRGGGPGRRCPQLELQPKIDVVVVVTPRVWTWPRQKQLTG